jgi:hypothetical protein
MSDSHVVALGKLAGNPKFTPSKETGIHHATRKALVNQGLATVDASGDKIKITAAGRSAYRKASKAK